jgi:transmembrane 9 superfamily member 2/4
VNKIYSDNTQLQYAYFELPFVCPPTGDKQAGSPFGSGHSLPLNLGEVLRGDRIMTSDFQIQMGRDVECQRLCNRVVTRKDVRWAQGLIEDGYLTEWILDNLPGATSFVTVDRLRKYYAAGFKIGDKELDAASGKMRYVLNNHFTLVVRWRQAPGKDGARGGKVVVGFEVYAKSAGGPVGDDNNGNGTSCSRNSGEDDKFQLYIAPNNTGLAALYPHSSYLPEEDVDSEDGATLTIPYSYSVYFREEESIEWANRWDLYFTDQEDNSVTHWLAIVNSLVISGILGAVVVVILGRTSQGGDPRGRGDGLVEDVKPRSNGGGRRSGDRKSGKESGSIVEKSRELEVDSGGDVLSDEEAAVDEVTGWKRLHGDVFRTPPYPGLFAPLIGSGMQLLFVVSGLLLLSCVGVLNPSFRGGFVSVGVGLFVFAGGFSGYVSARVYKTFGGQSWRKNMIVVGHPPSTYPRSMSIQTDPDQTAVLFPGLIFCLLFILNLFVWAQASSTALPFTTLVGLVSLWLLIQVPLVYIGSWYGYVRAQAWQHPTKTNSIARQIPMRSWNQRNLQVVLLAGLVPFAVLFIELLFVFKNLWQDKSGYYYMFGFLSVVSMILIITVSEVTIIATYVQLHSEDYQWWWQSFFVGGGSAIWMFAYCIWYYASRLHIQGFVSGMLFFSYSFLACVVYGLLTGTVGFLTAFAFVRRLYRLVLPFSHIHSRRFLVLRPSSILSLSSFSLLLR